MTRKLDREFKLGTLTFRDNTGISVLIDAGAGEVRSGVRGADPHSVRFDTSMPRQPVRFGREVGPLLTLAMLGAT